MKRSKILLVIGTVTGLIALGTLYYLLLFTKQAPAERFRTLLAEEGIDKPNIILITLDTTRADHLPCYGYRDVKTPHLDSLSKKGILFENCTASAPLTLPSHCSMMTGLYPTYHGVRINGNTALSEVHMTLAELFAQQGYQCGAFIAAFVLDGRWGLNQGFHHYDDYFDLKKYKQLDLALVQRPGNKIMDSALAWLEKQKKTPFFAWIHFYDPHTPYEPPEPYFSEYNTSMSALYDGEIAFADEQIGRCIAWMVENGLDRNSILAIIGDHGEGLGSHDEMSHGYYIYDYAVQVPFLIITPLKKFEGIRVSSQVRTIDIYPTLLKMAGQGIPGENQGDSLLDLIFHPGKKKSVYAYSESLSPNIHYGWSPLQSLRTPQFKYINAPRPELYDLIRDPEEKNNVADKFPNIAQEFGKALDEVIKKTGLQAPKPEAANLDSDTLDRLAALGYIGAPVSKKSIQKKIDVLADPKDKLHIYESVNRAGELINHEKYKEGARVLESVLQEEPLIPQAVLLLATCYVELNRNEDAKVQYDLLLKDDPNSIQALIGLANVLLEEGNKDDVIALCKQTLSVDDRNTQAYTILGKVYMNDNSHSLALPYLEKAVEIQPKLTRNRLNLAACYIGLKKYEKAEGILKDIIAKYPKYPLTHYHLGLLYEEQAYFDKARDAYLKEIALYPDHFRARFNLGKLLFKFGDQEGYLEHMREVIRVAPKAAEGYLFLARGLLYESTDINQIFELAQKGLSLAKSSELKAFGYFLLADIYNRKKQPDKVAEALKKANYYKSK